MANVRGSFAQSVNSNSWKIMLDVNEQVYKVARELFTSIVKLTPSPIQREAATAKGLLVNNWFPVNGSEFSSATTSSTSDYGAGSLTRIKALSGFNFFRKDGTVTLSNNLDYAYRAEVLGWPSPPWSGRVGPYRMVALSMQAVSARYK